MKLRGTGWKAGLFAAAAVVVAIVAWEGSMGAQPSPPTGPAASQRKKGTPDVSKVTEFMRKKLSHAQNSLEGLCTENFELIGKSSADKVAMSEATEWVVIGGQRYAQYSERFRSACDQLAKAAKAQDLPAAQLAWIRVNMECFDCHDYVRQVRIARAWPAGPQPAADSSPVEIAD